MKNYNIAIEMGSCNTMIFKFGCGVVLKEPTIVALQGNKKSLNCVGEDAKKLIGKGDNNITFVYPIEDGVITSREYSKLLLSEFFKKINNKKLFNRNKVVFIVPCCLSQKDINEFKNLGYSLNVSDVEILPSAFATLIGMSVDLKDESAKLVVNIGGGLTDIAVVVNSKIINGCSISVGGLQIENDIKEYVKENYNVNINQNTCEELMKEIGTLLPNDILSIKVSGINLDTNYETELEISSQELLEIMQNNYSKITNAIELIKNELSIELLEELNKNGVYICGGCANVSGLEKFFRTRLNLPIKIDSRMDLTTMNGAGILINNPDKLNEILQKINE